jgi:IS30 family transposase
VEVQRGAESKTRGGWRCDAPSLGLATSKHCKKQWNPEEATDWIRLEGRGALSNETFYQLIYRDDASGSPLPTAPTFQGLPHNEFGAGITWQAQKSSDKWPAHGTPRRAPTGLTLGDAYGDRATREERGELVAMVKRISRYTLIDFSAPGNASEVGSAIASAMKNHREKVHEMQRIFGPSFC